MFCLEREENTSNNSNKERIEGYQRDCLYLSRVYRENKKDIFYFVYHSLGEHPYFSEMQRKIFHSLKPEKRF